MSTAVVGLIFSAVSTVVGFIQQKNETAQRTAILNQQAQSAQAVAEQEEADFRRRQEALKGQQTALLGGAGVTRSGTPLLVAEDIAAEAELQALRIRHGGAINAGRLRQEAALEESRGQAASFGTLARGGASLISGLGEVNFGTSPSSAGTSFASPAGGFLDPLTGRFGRV